MDFLKKSENVCRYQENGETKERIDMVQYDLEKEGKPRGSVSLYAGHAVINLMVDGFDSIEAGNAKVREIVASLDVSPEHQED